MTEHVRGLGVPDWEADGLGELFTLYINGVATAVTPDAATVLGSPTRSWVMFGADHAAVLAE